MSWPIIRRERVAEARFNGIGGVSRDDERGGALAEDEKVK